MCDDLCVDRGRGCPFTLEIVWTAVRWGFSPRVWEWLWSMTHCNGGSGCALERKKRTAVSPPASLLTPSSHLSFPLCELTHFHSTVAAHACAFKTRVTTLQGCTALLVAAWTVHYESFTLSPFFRLRHALHVLVCSRTPHLIQASKSSRVVFKDGSSLVISPFIYGNTKGKVSKKGVLKEGWSFIRGATVLW